MSSSHRHQGTPRISCPSCSNSRYSACIYWLASEPDTLEARLDQRVDSMLDSGLLQEISNCYTDAIKRSLTVNYERGIMQSIGMKQFHEYNNTLVHQQTANVAQPDALMLQSIENMKTATRQYARSQIKWIRSRTLPQFRSLAASSLRCTFSILDSTDVTRWDFDVLGQSITSWHAFIDNKSYEPARSTYCRELMQVKALINHTWKEYTCDVCVDKNSGVKRSVVGDHEWGVHVQSRSHRKTQDRMNGPYKNKTKKQVYEESLLALIDQ